MFKTIIETDGNTLRHYKSIKNIIEKEIYKTVDEDSLVNLAITENLKKVEKINNEKSQIKEIPSDNFLKKENKNIILKLSELIAEIPVIKSPLSLISSEIMDDFLFQNTKPNFEVSIEIAKITSLLKTSIQQYNSVKDIDFKLQFLVDIFMSEISLKFPSSFCFLKNNLVSCFENTDFKVN